MLTSCGGQERVIAGAGTSISDSGLMANLAASYGGDLSIVDGSSAELLRLGDKGAIDVAIVHEEAQELAFMAEHPSALRQAVFESDFLLVGPPDLVGLIDAQSAVAAFEEIVANGWTFVTRDDNSGTNARELAIWAQAGVTPADDAYVATGQGMGFTLQVADQRDAFTLVEAGAYVAARDTLTLEPVPLAPQDDLVNPYSAILIDESARPFFEWLTTPEAAAALIAANNALFGELVYRPSN